MYTFDIEGVSCSFVLNSLQPHGLYPNRLLCLWNSPGMNTGVDCHSLLLGIFLTQGSNLGLPHCRQILYCLSYPESPMQSYLNIIIIPHPFFEILLHVTFKEPFFLPFFFFSSVLTFLYEL